MPVRFLTDAQREQLNHFPEGIDTAALIAHFTLSAEDRACIPLKAAACHRVAIGLQLGLLRFAGFFPLSLLSTPMNVQSFVAEQLGIITLPHLALYGLRPQTQKEHQRKLAAHLGFNYLTPIKRTLLLEWLISRALEHHRPSLLLELLLEWLFQQKIVRPSVIQLERYVATARAQASRITYEKLMPLNIRPLAGRT